MRSPLVSVLIPVYNAGKFLRPALESIRNQTYRELEILIINDGSTDGCMQSIADIRDPRIRMLEQPNAGKSIAMNRGLGLIQGEYYAIQDADDLSYPQRIERQVACLAEHQEMAAVFTGYDYVLGDRRLAPRFRGKDAEECRRDIESMRMPCLDPTVMFRVSMVQGVLYEPQLRIGQGMDYIFQVGERHPMVVLGECLYSYRPSPGSTTRQDAVRRQEYVHEVMRRARERRGLLTAAVLSQTTTETGGPVYREKEYGFVPHFMESVLDLRRSGQWSEALRTALTCAGLHPLDPHYYKPLAYLLAPLTSVSWYRALKREFTKVQVPAPMNREPKREAEAV